MTSSIPPIQSTGETPTPSEREFLKGTFSVRSPKTILGLPVLIAVSAYFWWLYLLPPGTHTKSKELPLWFAFGATIFTLIAIRNVIRGEKKNLAISTEGVRYGDDTWDWNQIKQVGLARLSFSSNLVPSITLSDSGSVRIFSLNKALAPAEGEKFLADLRTWLPENHPNIQIG